MEPTSVVCAVLTHGTSAKVKKARVFASSSSRRIACRKACRYFGELGQKGNKDKSRDSEEENWILIFFVLVP